MTNKSTRMPLTSCPWCGHGIDAAMKAHGRQRRPRPGDLSVCLGCAGRLVWGDDDRLRIPFKGELEQTYFAQPGLEAAMEVAANAVRSLGRLRPMKRR
jgi:hypothetical protein